MDKKGMLDAIITHYTGGNKAKFAALLGVSAQTISAWGTRNTFDSELIYTKCVGLSSEWLLTGEGPMLRVDDATALPSTPSTDTPAPSDTVVLRLMEKIDEKDAKIDQLQSELRQQSAELAALKAKYSEEPADNPVVLKTAKPASTKKRSSQPDADSATSVNVPLK